MAAYLARRFLYALIAIFAISIIAFTIIQLPPGDYVDAYTSRQETTGFIISQEQKDFIRRTWGLDKPIIFQYGKWLFNFFQGNFGYSMEHNRSARAVIGDRWILTLAVAGGTILFVWGMAIPIGIYSAIRQYSVGDHFFTFFGFLGLAVPNFLLAMVFMYFAVVWMGQSVGGLFSPDYLVAPWSFARVWDMIQHLWIPAIVLGTAGTAGLIRIMRANLLDELSKPYVVTARAKGLSERMIVLKYPTRVAANPVVSGVAFLIPDLFSGEIIVAVVLSLPTLGPVLLGALLNQDMFLSGSILMIIGILTVIGMLISDIMLVFVDPRIRLTG